MHSLRASCKSCLLISGTAQAVLLYDVLGLYLGQTGGWQTWLGFTGVASGVAFIAKQFFMAVR